MTFETSVADLSHLRAPEEHREEYVADLGAVADDVCSRQIPITLNLLADLPSGIYYNFSEAVNRSLLYRGYLIGQAERSGVIASVLAGLGMAVAYQQGGEADMDGFLTAAQDHRSTEFLHDLSVVGSVDGGNMSRTERLELVTGLTVANSATAADFQDAFIRLSTAFQYEKEGFFRFSDAVQKSWDRVMEQKPGGREGRCPMRSKIEEVFCKLTNAAAHSEELIPKTIGLGSATRSSSGLIIL